LTAAPEVLDIGSFVSAVLDCKIDQLCKELLSDFLNRPLKSGFEALPEFIGNSIRRSFDMQFCLRTDRVPYEIILPVVHIIP
jgi:hypothetical protein